MKIEYYWEDIVNKHYSAKNPLRNQLEYVIKDVSERYRVHIKTVRNWHWNDKVPRKYIEFGDNTTE